MINRKLFLAAASVALLASPANAATIVTQARNTSPFMSPGSMQGFDRSLGRLDRVTMLIEGTEHRILSAAYPQGQTKPITVVWVINGFANFRVSIGFANPAIDLALPILGAGAVTLTRSGFWEATTFGSATFAIDPSLIPDAVASSEPTRWPVKVGFTGPGFYDGSDTTFTTSDPIQLDPGGYYCLAGGGEETCNSYLYRLTYEYTPVAELGVPEPSTWLTMLLGFGLLGGALRSARRGARLRAA